MNDPAVVVSFPLVDEPETSFLAWTTTPWTLPSNLALCVNPQFEYVKIKDKQRGKIFYILEKRLSQLFPEVSKPDCSDERKSELYDVLERVTGEKLVGLKYKPIFDYFAHVPTAFVVLSDSYVTDENGTGIVHQAPAFGEDDYRVCIKHGVVQKGEDLPCPVDANGRFTKEVPDFAGMNVKEADNDICAKLKQMDRLIVKEVYHHSYPFCWRSDTPLIYKAIPSWFVKVESVKEKLLDNNAKTYWVPGFVGESRFQNWLKDAKDWSISRNRFWGTPIPLWVSDDFEEIVPVGSVEELYNLSGVRITDLHKDIVDEITIPSQQGKGVLRRVDEVFDCWFESGSMPYAQLHYPFENAERFEKGFPADFIAEGLDQTRGWFYTLTVLATCLFDKPAFKNLIVNGLVLAADGKKMSKRLKNYPDPSLVLDSYGADALRLYLIDSPVVCAEVLRFTESGVSDVVRNVLLPWFNAFRFYIQCVERWELNSHMAFTPNTDAAYSSSNDVDIWILAAVTGLVKFVHQEMAAYRLYTVVPRLVGFIEELTNWYVRLNRDRLKGAAGEDEANLGLHVLSEVLLTMTVTMAPFTPFFAEYLYQHLRKRLPLFKNNDPSVPVDAIGKAESVHYLMLPVASESRLNVKAEARFKVLQEAVKLSRTARERRHIRTNLPLKNVVIVAANDDISDALNYLRSYFLSEVNAWDMTISNEWEKMCVLKTVPNWKDLGKRLGKRMKDVAKAITDLTQQDIVAFMESGRIVLCDFELTKEDLVVKREFSGDSKTYEAAVSDDGSLLVAIDTTCDEELFLEMRSRVLISSAQKLRKSSGLVMTDVVDVFFEESTGTGVQTAVSKHGSAIVKKLKCLPLPNSLRPKHSREFAKDVIRNDDVSKGDVNLYFTVPCVATDDEALLSLTGSESAAGMLAMYIQTADYERVIAAPIFRVNLDNVNYIVERGVHYFSSATELALRSPNVRKVHSWLPSSLEN